MGFLLRLAWQSAVRGGGRDSEPFLMVSEHEIGGTEAEVTISRAAYDRYRHEETDVVRFASLSPLRWWIYKGSLGI